MHLRLSPARPAPPLRFSPAPSRSTPWTAWALALPLAVLTALSVTEPKVGVLLIVFLIALGLGAWILARPIDGLVLAMWIYPFYGIVRAGLKLYGYPVPVVVGMWPEIILAVIFVSVLLTRIRERKRLEFAWDDLPIVVLLVGGVYGALVSLLESEPAAAIYGFHNCVSTLLFYFAARWIRPSEGDMRRIVRVFFVTFSIVLVLSLLDYALRPRLMTELQGVTRPELLAGRDPYLTFSTYVRMTSILLGEGLWGVLCALASFFCLSFLTTMRASLWVRVLLILSTVCIPLTLSRGALLCWLTGIFVLLMIRGPHRLRIVTAIVTLVILLGIGFWRARETAVTREMITRADALINRRNPLAQDRRGQQQWAMDRFTLMPSGLGLGRAGYSTVKRTGGGELGAVADGGYFRVLAEQGLFGILTLVTGILGVTWVLVRHLQGARGLERVLGMVTTAYLWGIAADNLGHNAFDYAYHSALLWMFAGLFVARRLAPQTGATPRR